MQSADGGCAVWLGAVDDLWKLGKPIGRGGPWTDSPVRKDDPSDPYLCVGYDHKTLWLSHDSAAAVTIRVEADISGTGFWQAFRRSRWSRRRANGSNSLRRSRPIGCGWLPTEIVQPRVSWCMISRGRQRHVCPTS